MGNSVLPPPDSAQDGVDTTVPPVQDAAETDFERFEILGDAGRREFDSHRADIILKHIDECMRNSLREIPVKPASRTVLLLNSANDPVAFIATMDFENFMFISRAVSRESNNIIAVEVHRKGAYTYVNDPALHKLLFE